MREECRSQTRLANRGASVQAVNSMVLQGKNGPEDPDADSPGGVSVEALKARINDSFDPG